LYQAVRRGGGLKQFTSESRRQRTEELAKHTYSSNIIDRINRNPHGRLIALDIDQCSAFGEDTNDIMQIISRMTKGLDPFYENARHLIDIAELLINPRMIEAVTQIRSQAPDNYIVFYTSKEGIVNSFIRRFDPQPPHYEVLKSSGLLVEDDDDTLKFKAGNLLDRWEYLYNQLPKIEEMPWLDTSSAHCEGLRRVAILTWVASKMLGLPYAAPVYITRGDKDMRIICEDLGIHDVNKSVLFDDRAVDHAQKLGLSLAEARMVPVTPHGTKNTSKEVLRELYDTLQRHFPIKEEFALVSIASFICTLLA